ncbi:hypothetical protein Daus18300_012026 [Diaporthe australafricana]|uniref:Uncharacterized protein n=1 Tax=Diaporthe australafricana TaxID=127596 RepID=A0ABR3W4H4_9PEZI
MGIVPALLDRCEWARRLLGWRGALAERDGPARRQARQGRPDPAVFWALFTQTCVNRRGRFYLSQDLMELYPELDRNDWRNLMREWRAEEENPLKQAVLDRLIRVLERRPVSTEVVPVTSGPQGGPGDLGGTQDRLPVEMEIDGQW